MQSNIEHIRQTIQQDLDKKKNLKERNELGQFATPFQLASDIVAKADLLLPQNEKINFLDPAIGTGVFYSALAKYFPEKRIRGAKGYEIDKHYGEPAKKLWNRTILDYEINDFTLADYPENEDSKYNLIICNPPYVRHHHLNGQKILLRNKAKENSGIQISGLAGLYCYFLTICHKWMSEKGIAIWLIPSEFMDVNYGNAIKEYLTSKVSLIQIHRFPPDDVQFSDALVTTSIVIIKNEKPKPTHKVLFTFGSELLKPHLTKKIAISDLKQERKWTKFPQKEVSYSNHFPKLKDFFKIKRGIATGDNSFFILSKQDALNKKIPFKFLKPILPSPRYVSKKIIKADSAGNPVLERQLFVLDCKEPIDIIKNTYPNLYDYLEEGKAKKVTERYICKNRKIWYAQENRKISDFFFTYIGRGNNADNTFRFILNNSKAIANNSYLMLYPNEQLQSIINEDNSKKEELLKLLNDITQNEFIEQGRVYGGGMRKFEPKELAEVNSTRIKEFIKEKQQVEKVHLFEF